MKKTNNLNSLFYAILLIIFITTCGRKNSLSVNSQPTIRITSSYGVDSPSLANDTISFQQIIYWKGEDSDGSVEDFAFRILKEDGSFIETPDFNFVDADGWVYHYQSGADESIPMDDPNADLTIWTSDAHATINFPANVEGDSASVMSVFEVKCKDNYDLESNIIQKYYTVNSLPPSVNIDTASTLEYDIAGKTVGLGVIFKFEMFDNDAYVDPIPDYFLYKLEKRIDDESITNEDGYGEWFSTINQDDVSLLRLTRDTYPTISANTFVDDTPLDSTFLFVKAVDKAGIESLPDSISFAVKDGFSPESLIYVRDTFVLGENHFTPHCDETINKVIPSTETVDGLHYSTPFWIDKDGDFTAINSNDLKIYFHWGWRGEYAEDDPFSNYYNDVEDANGNLYYSKIEYFDIRLNEEPYYYAPLPPESENLITDENGKSWFRIPINHEIAQNIVLLNLESTTHNLEIRAVDLQGEVDQSPANFTFQLIEQIAKEDRADILIIDDDPHHSIFAPDSTLDAAYRNFLSDFNGGLIDEIERESVFNLISNEMNLAKLHFNKSVFSPTDLQNYKAIIYHSDNMVDDCNFGLESDPLNLYLKGGGNIIFSSGSEMKNVQDYFINNGLSLFAEYFGIPAEEDIVNLVTFDDSEGSFLKLQFFNKAIPENGTDETIYLQLPNFVDFVTSREGLGPVAYFENHTAETFYKFGCKEPETGTSFEEWDDVDDFDQFPSQNQYNEFNGKPVAIRKITENNHCYIFGFPLSFMRVDDVKNIMNTILSELD